MKELCLTRNTVIEMVLERGYTTSNKIMDYATFITEYPSVASNPSVLNFICMKDQPLAVHFTTEDKLSKKSLEGLSTDYSAQGITDVILITTTKLNPACKVLLKTIKLNVEHFLVDELQFNVTKHNIVPKHKLMTIDEQKDLLKKLKCGIENLPEILTTDPVARFFGAKVGDVFEIRRPSQTAGHALYYRAVREPTLK